MDQMVDFSALLIIISSIRYNRDIANGAQNIVVLRYFRTIGDISCLCLHTEALADTRGFYP